MGAAPGACCSPPCRNLLWDLSLARAPRGVEEYCWSWLPLAWSEEEGRVENFQMFLAMTECQGVNRDVNQRCQPASYLHPLHTVIMACTVQLAGFRKYFAPMIVGWWLLLQIVWKACCGHTASASSLVSSCSASMGCCQQ